MNDHERMESIHGKYVGGALWQVGATLSAAGGVLATGWVGYFFAAVFLVIGWSMLAQGRAELQQAFTPEAQSGMQS